MCWVSSGWVCLRAGAEAGGDERHCVEDIDRYAGFKVRDVYRRFAGLWIAGARKGRRAEGFCFAIVLQKSLTLMIAICKRGSA